MNYDFQGQRNLWKSTLTFLILWNCQKCFFGKRWVNYKKVPCKMKIMYLSLYKLTLSQLFFGDFWEEIQNQFMNIFLRLWKNISVFLTLLPFSVLVIYVLMERLYEAVCCCFLLCLTSFQQHVYTVTFFISW